MLAVVATPVADAAKKGKTRARKAQTCQDADLWPAATNLSQLRRATLCLLNAERTKRGLRRLSSSRQLSHVARTYSASMVRDGFFAHVSPAGTTMLSRVRAQSRYLKGARSFQLGENLAWGSGARATPRQTMIAWMRSPGHRDNILDKRFRHVGIGIALGAPAAVGSAPAATYVTEFGRRTRRASARGRAEPGQHGGD